MAMNNYDGSWVHEMIATHQTMKDRLMTDIIDDMCGRTMEAFAESIKDTQKPSVFGELQFSVRKANEELALTPMGILRAALADHEIELNQKNNHLTRLVKDLRRNTKQRDCVLTRITSLQAAITMLSNDETIPGPVKESVKDPKRCDW